MIPVQVGTRVVDWVDAQRAICLARAQNVKKVVRRRKDGAVMRIILVPHVAGTGWTDSQSDHENSCKSTIVERLNVTSGMPFVYSHKPSRLYTSSGRLTAASASAPTTTPARGTSGSNVRSV